MGMISEHWETVNEPMRVISEQSETVNEPMRMISEQLETVNEPMRMISEQSETVFAETVIVETVIVGESWQRWTVHLLTTVLSVALRKTHQHFVHEEQQVHNAYEELTHGAYVV